MRYLPKLIEDQIPEKLQEPRDRHQLTIQRTKDIPQQTQPVQQQEQSQLHSNPPEIVIHKVVDPITPIADRESSAFHQTPPITTLNPPAFLELTAPRQQKSITLPLQKTTKPIVLLKAKIQTDSLIQNLPPVLITQSVPTSSVSRQSSFSENQNVTDISFLPIQQT
jgi:hypothetical protein